MSGSRNDYSPIVKREFDCDFGTIVTNLASLNVDLLSSCVVGQYLNVIIFHNTVVVENANGEILGSILHEMVNGLKDCLNAGCLYEAEIITLSSFNCKVRIQKSN